MSPAEAIDVMIATGPTRTRLIWTAGAGFALLLATLLFLAAHEETSAISGETALRISFVVAVNLSIAALVAFLSRRILFAGFITALLAALITIVSIVKIRAVDMSLHAYDIVLYLNWRTLAFFWSEYRIYPVLAIATLALAVVLAVLVWRFDRTRCPRAASGLLLIAALAATAMLTGPTYAIRRPGQVFGTPNPISNFYLSFNETFHALTAGRLLEAAAQSSRPPFAAATRCQLADRPAPTVLLIHQESLMPPSLFPSISYDHGLDPFFVGDDKELHKLRVETYGGYSMLSDFSLLTGISSKSFGDMRTFLHVFMRNKLKEALPQIFETCGYRNALFFPLAENFISIGKFYRTIGFDTIFDAKAQHAPSGRERDAFYFKSALDMLERAFKSGDHHPFFVYVQTMMGHGPYDSAFMPELSVPGGGPGTPADMNEFLRRLSIAKIDYDFLVAELKRRFPDKPFLIVRYGDHQPTATRGYLRVPPGTLAQPNTASDGFVTFYAMTGVNYVVPPLRHYDALDIAFLGTMMLEAAGIPLPESYQERRRLTAVCNGQYYDCPRPGEILAFHRRLINSDIVQEQ